MTTDIRYRCPYCGTLWEDAWTCAVNGECPLCKTRHIEPLMWKRVGEPWSSAQEAEWLASDKCVCGHGPEGHRPGPEFPPTACEVEGCDCKKYKCDMSRYERKAPRGP